MRDTDLKPARNSSFRIAPEPFLDAALDAIVGINLEGEIIEFNRAAERMFGRRRADVLGQPLPDLLLPERDRERYWRNLRRCLEGIGSPPSSRRAEVTGMRADGSEFPAEMCVIQVPNGSRPRFLAFVQDITDRKCAENALRSGEEQLRLITNALPALVASVDLTGRYAFVNTAFERWFGRPREELIGRSVREVVGEETYRTLEPSIRSALEGREVMFEAQVDGPGGARRWIQAHYVPRKGPEGVLGYVSLVTDVTGAKQNRDEIQRLNASLEERVAERTARLEEALGQLDAFAYSVSHDLRAPLRAMRGFSQALLEDYAGHFPDDLSREYLRRISQAAERMDDLIQDLLAYSRIGRGEIRLEPIVLETLVDGVLSDMGTELRGTAVEVERPLPPVTAHPTTLAQVLKNLLSNAAKFVPPDATPRIRIRAEEADGRVRLWVEDNGIGIAPQHQERIFRVFERLHPSERYPGTGVGLAIVKKGVERMDGAVGLDSAPGRGSRFWLDLPAADGPAPS